jgi:hypothetical protein
MRTHVTAALAALSLAPCAALAVDPPLTCTRLLTGIDRPTQVTHAPGDLSRIFIVEQTGKIRIVDIPANTPRATPFINLSTKITGAVGYLEYGVLGVCFHPNYQQNGFFYVTYTPGTSTLADFVVARYHVSAADPNVADLASEQIILRVPYTRQQHRAGWMGFLPDGYLYVTTGDGGENDPDNAASTTTNTAFGLRGKILRLDVNGPDGIPGTADDDGFPADNNKNYRIPADNPWASDGTHAQEIWAYGLRNPWRASIDPLTHDLFIGDVGQSAREEIDVVRWTGAAAATPYFFGWRCREGSIATTLSGCPSPLGSGIPPLLDYSHSIGNSVTGGEVYRGCAMPGLRGAYMYADWGGSKIWTIRYNRDTNTYAGQIDRTTELAVAGQSPAVNIDAFGTDGFGEIYWVRSPGFATANAGELWKLVPRQFSGADCNGNSIADDCELLSNPALDADHNGVIDTCEPCGPADVGKQGGLTGFDRLLDNNDFIAFINLFFNSDPLADQGQQGGLPGSDSAWDNNDFIAFINHFFNPPAGC